MSVSSVNQNLTLFNQSNLFVEFYLFDFNAFLLCPVFSSLSRDESITFFNFHWFIYQCGNQFLFLMVFFFQLLLLLFWQSNWVCEDDWRPNFAQSMFFAGSIVGSLLFGLLADRYGRLPVLVMSNILACGAGVATGFSKGFVDFVIYRFLVGMAYDLHYM